MTETNLLRRPMRVRVEKRLRVIRYLAAHHRDEEAHRWERKLYVAVLRELAAREPQAAAAVQADDIDFSRWFA